MNLHKGEMEMARKNKLVKSTLSILLVLLLTITCMPITANASATLDVVNIEVKPITLITQTNGDIYNEYDFDAELFHKYYHYEPENIMEYTVTFSNGVTIKDSGTAFVYNGKWYYLDCETNQNSKNQWTAGNTYTMTVSLNDISVDVPVTITESPFESIKIEPISIIENNNGEYREKYNPVTDSYDLEYYHYCPEDIMEFTITLNDGTTITDTGDYFTYNGLTYDLVCKTDQDYKNQWTAGNTYTMKISLSNLTVNVPVTITKSPFKSIEVKPITIVAGTNGDYSYGYNPETDDYDLEYYYYYPQDIMEYTITLNDGTTISGTGYEFDYKGQTYSISSYINQDYENRWTVGNTYTFTVYLNNISAEVPVTITESPFKSIEIEPITITEYTNGDYYPAYNPETNQMDLEYYRYFPAELMKYSITLNDGTKIKGTGSTFYYNDEYHYLDYKTNQSYNNQWTAGNTYTVNVSLSTTSVDVPVTITSSTPTPTLKGDVDGDGLITIKDATMVQEHVARYKNLTDTSALNADVDGSGDINIVDATYIQMYVAKQITSFDKI